MQNTFTIDGYDYTFRTKKMNAFEALGMQTQINFNDSEDAQKFFKLCLEFIEVECKGVWIPVKEKGHEIYAPAEIEENVDLLQKLVNTFMNDYLLKVFQKSGE